MLLLFMDGKSLTVINDYGMFLYLMVIINYYRTFFSPKLL